MDDLAQILKISQTELVFTVDAFFIGEKLHHTKQILDEAIETLNKKLAFIKLIF